MFLGVHSGSCFLSAGHAEQMCPLQREYTPCHLYDRLLCVAVAVGSIHKPAWTKTKHIIQEKYTAIEVVGSTWHCVFAEDQKGGTTANTVAVARMDDSSLCPQTLDSVNFEDVFHDTAVWSMYVVFSFIMITERHARRREPSSPTGQWWPRSKWSRVRLLRLNFLQKVEQKMCEH